MVIDRCDAAESGYEPALHVLQRARPQRIRLTDPRQNSSELNLARTPATIPHAGTAHCGRPRTHVGASRSPGAGVGEPGPAATTGRLPPNDAMPSPGARSTVLDRVGAALEVLAYRVSVRCTRHRRTLASQR